ncbi:MAG TPA: HEAT repeat domain-containing protein [Pirellulaceae bacterium]|nr:HEAT repeat domain-containing protein [Pirellulaceae bacterium]
MPTSNTKNRFLKLGLVVAALVAGVYLITGTGVYLISGIRTALVASRLFNLRPGDTQSIPYALDSLQSDSPLIRRAAARGLGYIGPEAKAAIPALLVALKRDCWEVASEAAASLGSIKSPEPQVIDGLTAALKHKHGEVRRYAAYSLSQYGQSSRSAVPELMNRLSDPQMGYMAARALGEIGLKADGVVAGLTELLSSAHPGQRAEAAVSLSKLLPLPQETIAKIEKLTGDDEKMVRDAASKSLQSIRNFSQR